MTYRTMYGMMVTQIVIIVYGTTLLLEASPDASNILRFIIVSAHNPSRVLRELIESIICTSARATDMTANTFDIYFMRVLYIASYPIKRGPIHNT